jgi:hypothetical protein
MRQGRFAPGNRKQEVTQMANKALAKLGWRKIWVVCYRAKNGLWYPATHMLFCSRGKADTWLKPCKRQDPEGRYRVLRYLAD